MLARTKKPPTEIELRFKGPEHKRQEAVNVLREMGLSPEQIKTLRDRGIVAGENR